MKVAVIIDETQLNTLKKACAIAAKDSTPELTLKIAETIGDITYQFEKN